MVSNVNSMSRNKPNSVYCLFLFSDIEMLFAGKEKVFKPCTENFQAFLLMYF